MFFAKRGEIIKKILGRIAFIIIALAVIGGVVAMTINSHVVNKGKEAIISAVTDTKDTLLNVEIDKIKDFDGDCIMVLGAGIRADGKPSAMLRDRLDTGIMLYKKGVAPKLLLTGDNGSKDHNEIQVMLNYAKEAGVPSEDIFCDHAGFSTYDSMYRAQSIFDCKRIVVATQTYHEYRALYIGDKLGLSVMGVASDQKKYRGQATREVREVLARVKDFFKVIAKPEATFGGDVIPISGSGIISHGE